MRGDREITQGNLPRLKEYVQLILSELDESE